MDCSGAKLHVEHAGGLCDHPTAHKLVRSSPQPNIALTANNQPTSFVHLYLAIQAFYYGLALRDLFQWIAWRALPPDCPNCNSRLRPSLPEFPWLKRFRRRDYAPVFTDEAARYHDEPEASREPAPQPEAVEVRRKDRKGKGAPAAEEPTPWGA